MIKLRRSAPPTKDAFGQFWWVRDRHSQGQIIPVRVVVWRDELTFSAVGYQRCGELGWTAAGDSGVEWYGPIGTREAVDD